jgi:hypothetical protein
VCVCVGVGGGGEANYRALDLDERCTGTDGVNGRKIMK